MSFITATQANSARYGGSISFIYSLSIRLCFVAIFVGGLNVSVWTQETLDSLPLPQRAISLLHQHCFSCHNEDDRKGDLVLTSRAAIDSSNLEFDLLVPGKPESSALIAVLASEADPHMPPKQQLEAGEIELLSDWVQAGGEWSENTVSAVLQVPLAPARLELTPVPSDITPVLAIAISPDERQLAAGLGSRVRVITDPTLKENSLVTLTGHRDIVRSLAWNPIEPQRLASGGYRRIVYWDTEAAEPIVIVESQLSGQVSALHFSQDGSMLFAGVSRPGISGEIYCWSVPEFNLMAKWKGHHDTIFSIDISPDGSFLASASGDRNIVFWETDTLEEHSRIEAHGTQIMEISFSPSSNRLVTAGTDNQLRVWEWAKGDPLFQLGRHKRGLFAARWAQDGASIIAGDEHGTLYRYTEFQEHSGAARARTAKETRVKTLSETIQSLAMNTTGDMIGIGTQSGTVHVVDSKGKVLNSFEP